MISNERSWPGLRKPYRQPYQERPKMYAPRPMMPDETLATQNIQIERKHFSLTLRENARGRFLRISEEVAGRFNQVIIPASGLREFQKVVEDLLKANEQTPAAASSGEPPAGGNDL